MEIESYIEGYAADSYSGQNPIVYRYRPALQLKWRKHKSPRHAFRESYQKPFSCLYHKEGKRKCHSEEIDCRCMECMAGTDYGFVIVGGLWCYAMVFGKLIHLCIHQSISQYIYIQTLNI